jgi:hypothetical protein
MKLSPYVIECIRKANLNRPRSAEEKRKQLDQVSKHSEEINNIKNDKAPISTGFNVLNGSKIFIII